jgi:flagellar basal body-associated protein FliL
LGILSVVSLGLPLGIPAWVMARRDLKRMKEGTVAVRQKGLTQSGMVFGIVGTFLSPLTAFLVIVIIAATTTLIFKAQSNVGSQREIGALSPTYTARESSLAFYDNIEQIRGQTADEQPAVFLVLVSLGYNPAENELSVELGNRNREIQELILKDISSKTATELSPAHYDEIQSELQQLINMVMKTGKVKAVIFRQFSVVK